VLAPLKFEDCLYYEKSIPSSGSYIPAGLFALNGVESL
jgi:hypothetical protein